MRIAYLSSLYPYASDTYVRNEVDALRLAGWQISTFAVRRPPESMQVDDRIREEASRTEYLLTGGLLTLCVAIGWAIMTRPLRLCGSVRLVWTSHAAGFVNRLRQWFYVAEACLLARRLLQKGICHLHNHVAENSATVAMLASHLSGVPFSMTVHGPGIFFHPRQWGLGEKVRRSAFTVCITEFCRSQCMAVTPPECWNRLRVVHCGLGDDFIAEKPDPVPQTGGFVCVGRVCPEKGHAVLLDAVRRLVQAGLPVELTIIGDGPMRVELERRREEWGLGPHVRFLGWQSSMQIREQIMQARCLVVASFAEGLPMVIMEALALCRPVITTWVAGIPELVENGADGWLVPPGSAEALARAMEESIRYPSTRLDDMGRHGRQKVLREHNASTEAAKLAGIFRRAVELA